MSAELVIKEYFDRQQCRRYNQDGINGITFWEEKIRILQSLDEQIQIFEYLLENTIRGWIFGKINKKIFQSFLKNFYELDIWGRRKIIFFKIKMLTRETPDDKQILQYSVMLMPF